MGVVKAQRGAPLWTRGEGTSEPSALPEADAPGNRGGGPGDVYARLPDCDAEYGVPSPKCSAQAGALFCSDYQICPQVDDLIPLPKC